VAKGKKKSGSKKAAENNGAPKRIVAKANLSQGAFMKEVVFAMEDDLRVSNKQAKDFMDSLIAVIERELSEGNAVNFAGLVKLSPVLQTKGERMIPSEFGNPESPKVKKKYPAKVTVKATAMKKAKDALPSVQKLQKVIG
jgi:nucleoid DNA-binding protein